MSTAEIFPFFFGPENERLYGCLDQPKERSRSTGVLLCNPIGAEYFSSHRGLRQLSSRLAQKGFPVLRFDYYGTGDSSGDSDQASFRQMHRDLRSALSELRQRSRCSTVVLLGQRLGGSLILSSALSDQELSGVVLWDPVLRGAELVAEIRDAAPERGHVEHPPVIDLHGHTWTASFLEELKSLDVAAEPGCPAPRMLIVETDGDGRGEALAASWRARGVETDYFRSESAQRAVDDVDRIAVPAKAIQRIVTWVGEASP